MKKEYYVFFDDLNDVEIDVLDYYWLIDDQNEFFYTVDKIILMFNLDGYGAIKRLLKKTAKVRFLNYPAYCSKCNVEYYLYNRNEFRNKKMEGFNDICDDCISKNKSQYAIHEWEKVKKRVLSKNIYERFVYLPYHLKIVVFSYLNKLKNSELGDFTWSNLKIVGEKSFDDLIFQQLVMEGVMYKFEGGRIFDASKYDIKRIDDVLNSSLKGSELEEYLFIKKEAKDSGFISIYNFYDFFENIHDDLKFYEENIRVQILRDYDIYQLKDFILDLLADRCVKLCFYKKSETKVDFCPSQKIYGLFKEMVLRLSVSQVYSIIYNAFKDVASFLYSNNVNEYSKPHLIRKFISRRYHNFLMDEKKIPSFDLYSFGMTSIFEDVLCNYIFHGEVRSLNDFCVNDIIRFFMDKTSFYKNKKNLSYYG
ncbi:hypothetical protein [Marinomonas sp.]